MVPKQYIHDQLYTVISERSAVCGSDSGFESVGLLVSVSTILWLLSCQRRIRFSGIESSRTRDLKE